MKRQRNTTQMKVQTRNTEIQINEEEIGKLPEKVFRIMIVKTLKTKCKKTFSRNFAGQREWQDIVKGKIHNQDYFTLQGSHSELMER